MNSIKLKNPNPQVIYLLDGNHSSSSIIQEMKSEIFLVLLSTWSKSQNPSISQFLSHFKKKKTNWREKMEGTEHTFLSTDTECWVFNK